MDDETAEIELLEQNLQKTRQISKRMTSILDSFDTRLAKLEKSILPLYTAAQILNRRSHNIDQALSKIDEMAGTQEDLIAEEAMILRGPQTDNSEMYKEALNRLNAKIAFNPDDLDLTKTARLVETGAKKLTQLYTTIVAEGSSGATSKAPGSLSTSFPSSLLSNLLPLVSYLHNLPLPSTHPSHPAAPAILSTLTEAQKGYADMRGNWSVKCLEGQGKRIVTRADTMDPISTGMEFGQWVKTLLAVAEDEYKLLKELSPLTKPESIASSYGALIKPILNLFGTVLNQLTTLIKKSLQKHSFLALSAYDALLQRQPSWEEVLLRRGSEYFDDKNELRDGLQALRQVCLRSFPEFLVDLKLGANNRDSDTSVQVVDLAVETVRYLERIPKVRTAVSSALLALGDGNWKMGEGVQVGKTSQGGVIDETVILEHFLYDVVTNAINSLNAISRLRRPAFGSIFLLNNISYLRHHLLQSSHPDLLPLISQPTIDTINSNWRTAKAAYFDTNFTQLMQAITDDPKEKTGKSQAKEKFTRFFDLLEEVVERHRMAEVLGDDKEARDAVADEIVMLVIPSLNRFTQKQKEKEFSRNPQKYIKQSPDDVEARLRNLYN